MAARASTRAALLHLSIETFFAILPLIVMSLSWPPYGQHHPSSFWLGPEISMTSCILYGLGLSKLLQGSVIAAMRSGRSAHAGQTAAAYGLISLIPTLGIILSVIAINRILGEGVGIGWYIFQYVNLILAIVTFFLVGGFGIKRAESEAH